MKSISMKKIKQIESIVKEQGLEFRPLNNPTEEEVNLIVAKPNPNAVYLIMEPSALLSPLLLYHGREYSIDLNGPGDISMPGIRNWIKGNNMNNLVCGICYEQQWNSAQCATCGFTYCPICCVKIVFDKWKFDERVRYWNQIDFEQTIQMQSAMECPQCKGLNGIDILRLYVLVIHKLDCFNKDQQALLRYLADNDPNFHYRLEQMAKLEKQLGVNGGEQQKTNHKCENEAKEHKNNEKEGQAQPKKTKQKKKRRKQTGWKKGFLNN
eukprot:222324_1